MDESRQPGAAASKRRNRRRLLLLAITLVWFCTPWILYFFRRYLYPGVATITLALGIAVIAGAVTVIPALFARSLRDPPLGHCQNCGYDLIGNTSGRCPECGCEPTSVCSECGAPQPRQQ